MTQDVVVCGDTKTVTTSQDAGSVATWAAQHSAICEDMMPDWTLNDILVQGPIIESKHTAGDATVRILRTDFVSGQHVICTAADSLLFA